MSNGILTSMNHDERRRRQLEHLERQRQMVNERLELQTRRLERQREEIDKRFARAKRHLGGSDTAPSDEQRRIIAAAIELLDEVGLNDLSLRKLALKLDFKAPALYWHFKNKDSLIDYMAEGILTEEFTEVSPRGKDEDWQAWFMELCRRLRRAMLAHRDGARIVAGAHLFPAVTLVRLLEAASDSLVSAGVNEERAELIITTAVHFTFGRVIEEQSMPSMEQMEHINFDDMMGQFPHLAKSVQRIQSEGNLVDMSDREFDESLRLIIHA